MDEAAAPTGECFEIEFDPAKDQAIVFATPSQTARNIGEIFVSNFEAETKPAINSVRAEPTPITSEIIAFEEGGWRLLRIKFIFGGQNAGI